MSNPKSFLDFYGTSELVPFPVRCALKNLICSRCFNRSVKAWPTRMILRDSHQYMASYLVTTQSPSLFSRVTENSSL